MLRERKNRLHLAMLFGAAAIGFAVLMPFTEVSASTPATGQPDLEPASSTSASKCSEAYGSPRENGCEIKTGSSGKPYFDGSTCNSGYKITPWCDCVGGTMYGDNCYPP